MQNVWKQAHMFFNCAQSRGSNSLVPSPSVPASRIYPVQRPRKRNRLAHVVQAADPGDYALDAHAETGVGNAAISPQIEIPLEGFAWQAVRVDARAQQLI